jgi:hypothetical protein
VEQRPVSQLLTVSGTDLALPTKKDSKAEGLRQAASGEVRSPFNEFVQSVERLTMQLVQPAQDTNQEYYD